MNSPHAAGFPLPWRSLVLLQVVLVLSQHRGGKFASPCAMSTIPTRIDVPFTRIFEVELDLQRQVSGTRKATCGLNHGGASSSMFFLGRLAR